MSGRVVAGLALAAFVFLVIVPTIIGTCIGIGKVIAFVRRPDAFETTVETVRMFLIFAAIVAWFVLWALFAFGFFDFILPSLTKNREEPPMSDSDWLRLYYIGVVALAALLWMVVPQITRHASGARCRGVDAHRNREMLSWVSRSVL
jgi:hypothetical protein